MPWQGAYSEVHPRYSLQPLSCALYDLNEKRVGRITFFSHSFAYFRSRDLVCVFHECHTSQMLDMGLRRQGNCAQLANAWDSKVVVEVERSTLLLEVILLTHRGPEQ